MGIARHALAAVETTQFAGSESVSIMKMRIPFRAIVLGAALAAAGFAPSIHSIAYGQNPSAKQDMQQAGHDTKNAAKSAGNGTKKATSKAYNGTKKGTKKAYNKTKSTTQGAIKGGKQGAKQPQ
jgi:hypothetical protein